MAFSSLSISQTDMLDISVPVLNEPVFKRVSLEYKNPETNEVLMKFDKEDQIKQTIMTSAGMYSLVPSFSNIYLAEFPDKYRIFPNLIFRNRENIFGILMNINYTTMKYYEKLRKFTIGDQKLLATNILFGANKISCSLMDNITLLENIYIGLCYFIYSLFIRVYMSDFDMRSMGNKNFMFIFFLFSKMVANSYMNLESSDVDDVALTATRQFFSGVNVNPNELPIGYEIYTFTNVFKMMNGNNIMHGVTLSDFKNKITERFGSQLVISMINGVDLAATLSTINMGTIFSDRISTVSPVGINQVIASIRQYNKEVYENFMTTNQPKPIQTQFDWGNPGV